MREKLYRHCGSGLGYNCLKSKEQNERDSPFKIDKNFRENHLEGSDCHNMITVVKLPCQEMNPLGVK